jgi:hypothetical protein
MPRCKECMWKLFVPVWIAAFQSCLYVCVKTSRVPAALLWGNSTNTYIFSNLYCLKVFHRPDHSMHIIEYHRKKLSLNPTSSLGLEPRSFRVCDLSSCNLLAEANKFCLGAILLSCLVSKLQKTSVIFSSKQTALVSAAPFFCRA